MSARNNLAPTTFVKEMCEEEIMDESRTARTLGIVMSALLVVGITYLAFGERLGVKSAGPNAGHWTETAEQK